ncbi:hypothetical protein GGX14DRAFT_402530 [Mycena pura]|uniref:Uncharacterized protein n=1 Tax=Mycena pura TaxID=153505 RepID=A0AAD6UXP8_9AGAR|nr:hypothetical protein GGX14DRAFT_402530 [Mycena pura]
MYLRGIKPRNTFEVRGVSEASTWLRITRPHRTPDYRWGTRSPRPLHGPDFPNGFSEPKFRVLSFKIRVFGLVRAFSRHSARHRPAHCNEKKHVLNVSRMNEGGSAQAEQASRTKPASSHFFCRPIQSSGRKTPSDDKSISGPAIASGVQQAAAVAGEAGAKVAGAVADAIASARHASTPRTRRARFVEIVFLHITVPSPWRFRFRWLAGSIVRSAIEYTVAVMQSGVALRSRDSALINVHQTACSGLLWTLRRSGFLFGFACGGL